VRRFHLFEIEDQSWCPRLLRDAATDYLQFVFERFRQYEPVAREIKQLLRADSTRRVVDLCSGGGGPWKNLAHLVQLTGEHPVQIALTDRFPSAAGASRAGEPLMYVPHPVDATRVPAHLTGVRTMFTAFHHFDPRTARAVLRDAGTLRQPIAIFEVTQRSWWMVLLVALSPLLVIAATPFIRPFRWSRLLFTYVVPVLPLFIMFDGVVSCLRTYSPEELESLALGSGVDDYAWEAGVMRTGVGLPVTYLVGRPLA
jgi:hypothetical protein